jgi:hypothetical protein
VLDAKKTPKQTNQQKITNKNKIKKKQAKRKKKRAYLSMYPSVLLM